MKVRKLVTGFCPHSTRNKTIHVEGETMNFCGDPNEHFSKVGYKCDDVESCSFRNECPIYLSVQEY